MKSPTLILFCALIISSVFGTKVQAASAPRTIDVSDVWIRAVPKEVPHTAAYLTLKNSGDQEVRLIGASTSVAKTVELHNHTKTDGAMKMEKVEYIAIAPKSVVKLEPKGFHLMVFSVDPALARKMRVAFTLQFSDGTSQKVQARVRGFDHESHEHDAHH